MHRARRLTRREERRMRAAELLAARPRLTVRELARALGCSVGTAHADLQAIRAEWAERRRDLVEQAAAEDLARTDRAIAAIWPAVTAGKGWAIDRLVSLLTYRARVLGLERVRQEVDVGEVLAHYLTRLHAASEAG
jgi:DNA-binding transcriptional MocR family regulator